MNGDSAPRPTSLLFVDGTNLDHRLHAAFGRNDVDFPALFGALTAGTALEHVHYCTAVYKQALNPRRYRKQMADLNFLGRQANVTVHRGRYQMRTRTCPNPACQRGYEVPTEKGTDVLLATQLVRAAFDRQASRLILVSNDNDFWPALRMCQEERVHVEVAFVIDPRQDHQEQIRRLGQLDRHADRHLLMNEQFMSVCWRKRPGRQRHP